MKKTLEEIIIAPRTSAYYDAKMLYKTAQPKTGWLKARQEQVTFELCLAALIKSYLFTRDWHLGGYGWHSP